MSTQPEALRLADVIEFMRDMQRSEREAWRYADELDQERNRLYEVNQELLEALKWALSNINCEPYEWSDEENADAHEAARSVIAKATGEQA